MKQSTLVLEELTKRRDAIRAMLVDSRRLAREISGVLADNEAQLDPLMKDFKAALANLRKQEQKVTASIEGLGTMSRYFANAAGNGPWIDLHVPVGLADNLTCGAELLMTTLASTPRRNGRRLAAAVVAVLTVLGLLGGCGGSSEHDGHRAVHRRRRPVHRQRRRACWVSASARSPRSPREATASTSPCASTPG